MNAELNAAQNQMFEEILEGLCQPQKCLPSKYFYDERGSELFEKITALDEYYLTCTEKNMLKNYIDEITGRIGSDSVLVELGSGSSRKTRLLLEYMPGIAAYVPVDISEDYLMETVHNLKEEYPDLVIKPVCADYTTPFGIPEIRESFEYYVYFYPGSTIGNFQPEAARRFLKTIAQRLVPGGGLLIGVDLKKDPQILEAAYNDKEGITAEFNKNILARINREFNAGFKLEQFRHLAFYNEHKGRIEMHLESLKDQQVRLAGSVIHFDRGETIHTENSYKYSLDEFETLVSDWFTVDKVWMDRQELFSLQYLVKW